MSSRIGRVVSNLFAARGALARDFPPATMDAIRAAIESGERTHSGEIVFAVEPRPRVFDVLAGFDSRTCASEAFAALGVWDTAAHSGVGAPVRARRRRIPQRRPARGVLAAIAELSALLATHFPADPDNPRELPDAPFVL